MSYYFFKEWGSYKCVSKRLFIFKDRPDYNRDIFKFKEFYIYALQQILHLLLFILFFSMIIYFFP